MKFNRMPWDSNDPAFNFKFAATALVSLGIVILLAALCFVYRISAAGPQSPEQHLTTTPTATEPVPTKTESASGVTEPVPPVTEPVSPELIALQEALAAAQAERDVLQESLSAAEAERDALRAQLSDSVTDATQLREELDALRLEAETAYVLYFRVERSIRFPSVSEAIRFTCTVDEETYGRWEPGDVITDYDSFLTLPEDSLLHSWTVVLEDKFVTTNAQ